MKVGDLVCFDTCDLCLGASYEPQLVSVVGMIIELFDENPYVYVHIIHTSIGRFAGERQSFFKTGMRILNESR